MVGIERLAGESLNLFQAGAHQVVAADGAVIGQFQRERRPGLQRRGFAPQARVIDAQAEEAQLAFANQSRLWHGFAPARCCDQWDQRKQAGEHNAADIHDIVLSDCRRG